MPRFVAGNVSVSLLYIHEETIFKKHYMVETIILLHKTCSLMVNKLFSLTKHHLYGAQKFWRFILHYSNMKPISNLRYIERP